MSAGWIGLIVGGVLSVLALLAVALCRAAARGDRIQAGAARRARERQEWRDGKVCSLHGGRR
jgi:hypothetical protein